MPWQSEQVIGSRKFQCGFCGNRVASNCSFYKYNWTDGCNKQNANNDRIYICPHCENPSLFSAGQQSPGVAPGNDVAHLPSELEAIYNEARRCVSVKAYTAAVLVCRKLLMHIAVQQKAEEGKSFIYYVEFLANNGYVPPDGKGWVDHIRKKGNEATHEIILMKPEDATELIVFSEMLLKLMFEFPVRVSTT